VAEIKPALFAAGIALALAFTLSCSSPDDEKSGDDGNSSNSSGGGYTGSYGSVSHGGKTYKTVKIGTQTWFAENLNYDPGTGNSACYDNQASNCATYGRLYDWSTAMGFESNCNNNNECSSQIQAKHRGICPSGWHIPSNDEWYALGTAVGGQDYAGTKLRARTGWENCGPSGSGKGNLCEDTYGFSALPGGDGTSAGSFRFVGSYGHWWSASEIDSSNAYYWYTIYNYDNASWYSSLKGYLFSVRCLQD
jgi:uncharacterized protein (TIGR02145 family)